MMEVGLREVKGLPMAPSIVRGRAWSEFWCLSFTMYVTAIKVKH